MGSVHRLVLTGRAPQLEPFYPSVEGTDEPKDAWPAFRAVVEGLRPELDDLVQRPVQTNEVGRAAGLVGGFLTIARETGLPLDILELGASAGLNLRWDRFRYDAAGSAWGPEDSPVRLSSFEGEPPPFDPSRVVVAMRRGCDRAPLDPLSKEGRLTLSSYVWPDQRWRWGLLRAALEVASEVPVQVARASAAEWLGGRLAEPTDGRARVVFHSIVMQYLSPEERGQVRTILEEAGSAGTEKAPLAWLRMEPPGEDEEDDGTAPITLTSWPGGETRTLARCGYHGRPVRWLAGA
jgi:hypothetical protein